jgi:two-component system OmpR family sensor kinase
MRIQTRWRRLSLRARLSLVLVGLLSISCAALTVVTSVALHTYLIDRLDQQLLAAGNRYAVSLEHPNDHDADNDDFTSVVGQQAGTLGARSVHGVLTGSGIITDGSASRSIPLPDQAILARLPISGPRNLDLPELGDYRIVVTAGQDSDLLVTGLPRRPVDETIQRLALIEIMVFVVAMLLTGVAGAFCVGFTLRPLDRVSRTALSVAELPLAQGDVQLPQRLLNPAPGTEVGRVTAAVNSMLEHVESAFAERHASETLLRQFVADASHELRTPVAVIRSHAEYAQMTSIGLPFEVTEALSRITSESERMGMLVNDLLLLARLDAGRELSREQVDLTRIMLDAVIDARAVGSAHRWLLHLPDHEVLVQGDPNSLRQVMLNLLSNAAEHTPDGTVVTVGLVAGPDTVVATVTDTGPGIASEFLPHVFERFARFDSARHHHGGESGLGLAIVEAIVRAHDGTISVTSKPGETVFTFVLPAYSASAYEQ